MKCKERLHKLCSQALREEDPRRLEVLFGEIQSALSELATDVQEVLEDIHAVLKRKKLPRIQ